MNIKLSSKATTLINLKPLIKQASILDIYKLNVNDYINNKDKILKEVLKTFENDVIVRSSSINEDTKNFSNAGCFESILNVKMTYNSLENAINKVILSYGEINDKDEVFIQPMLKNVSRHGVVFTSELDTLSEYYIINYDESGSTTSVTEGTGKNLKTYICHKSMQYIQDKSLKKILNAIKECEKILDNNFLDIEFALIKNKIYILQVREIVKKDKENLSTLKLEDSLEKIYKKIQKLNAPHPRLLGEKSIFGVMPDWNPAEIIGIRPKKLALSLYKEIITDSIWAYQRDNYGYRNLRSYPLMVSFLGIPFIDARVSFNSFIPKNLEENTAEKLVNYYLKELSSKSFLHDKVEFKIVFSCYYFGIDKVLNTKLSNTFSKEEQDTLKNSLHTITKNIIDTKNGLYKKDLLKIDLLKKKFDEIINSTLSTVDKIYWLLEDCKRYGTLPFAGIARAAFIAMQLLDSLVEEKILTLIEKNKFLNTLNTVSKQLNDDYGKIGKEDFLKTYGHLRPGTYDIESLRYDQSFEEYFSNKISLVKNESFNFSPQQKKTIERLLKEHNFELNFDEFILFIKEAIEGREYAKLIFTKNLSEALNLIKCFGKRFGFSKEDMAHLDIKTLLDFYANLDHRDVEEIFKNNIAKNKDLHRYTKAIKLPSLILSEKDIYSFYLEKEQANFITQKSIETEIIREEEFSYKSIQNKIICIKAADPGYDYLFTKKIAGLITCYGGANSHMAIRCAELGIPAVIGCGESLFEKYKNAQVVNIDCLNEYIKIVK